jgi:hypothetical protein
LILMPFFNALASSDLRLASRQSLWACALLAAVLSMASMDQDALKLDLEYITQVRPLSANESFAQVLGRVDAIAQQASLPDRLQHYLSQRSYVKALVWLDNPDSPHHP